MRRILCIDADADMLEFMHDVFEDERVDCAPIAGAGLALAAHLPHLLRRVLFITGNWTAVSGVALARPASRCFPSRSPVRR
ncbi:MAG: hypothetical protein AUH30_10325 [Candidatus Rokubacteria bacterium 13_1_40CM_68_15]|nr:MAG: hypothetical protein AUH30_10325 [Candidatus Rokubacteria bacterium 13_1_40CM_68_15]